MIDFVKFITRVNPLEYEQIEYLEFYQSINTKTGELNKFKVSKHYGLTFCLYDTGLLIVSGSLHKYWNFLNGITAPNQHTEKQISDGYNGNDFGFYDIKTSLDFLADMYNLDLMECKVQNIESGLNIIHFFSSNKILDGLMIHKGKTFNTPINKPYKELRHQRYYIKIYDKAYQYGLCNPTLRIELKYKKMIDLNRMGLITLNDLYNSKTIQNLLDNVLKEFSNILIYDYTLNPKNGTKTAKKRLKDYSNPNFWKALKSNRIDRHKKALAEYNRTYSKSIQNNLRYLLEDKIKSLINN